MFNQLLSSTTFQDHADQPSFGRKACFWILISMGILAVFALCLIAFGPVATGKSVSAFALSLSKDAITLCGLFYGAAQLSKGMAQMGKPTTPESSALSVPGAPTPTQAIVAPTPIATEPTTSAKA